MPRKTIAELDLRLSALEKVYSEQGKRLDDIYKELEEYCAEIRQIRTWLLGDGEEGVFEQIRAITKRLEALQRSIATEKTHQNRVKVAVITGWFSLAGVLVMAAVQIAIHVIGG